VNGSAAEIAYIHGVQSLSAARLILSTNNDYLFPERPSTTF